MLPDKINLLSALSPGYIISLTTDRCPSNTNVTRRGAVLQGCDCAVPAAAGGALGLQGGQRGALAGVRVMAEPGALPWEPTAGRLTTSVPPS